MLVRTILKKLVKRGDLTFTDWKGRVSRYGDGSTPKVHIQITSGAVARKIALDPDLHLGEAYMSGHFKILSGTLYEFMELALNNTSGGSNGMHEVSRIHQAIYKARI